MLKRERRVSSGASWVGPSDTLSGSLEYRGVLSQGRRRSFVPGPRGSHRGRAYGPSRLLCGSLGGRVNLDGTRRGSVPVPLRLTQRDALRAGSGAARDRARRELDRSRGAGTDP